MVGYQLDDEPNHCVKNGCFTISIHLRLVVFSGTRNKRASKHAFQTRILRPSLKIGGAIFGGSEFQKKNRVLSVLIQALLVNADGKIVVNPPDFEIVFVEDVVWMVVVVVVVHKIGYPKVSK